METRLSSLETAAGSGLGPVTLGTSKRGPRGVPRLATPSQETPVIWCIENRTCARFVTRPRPCCSTLTVWHPRV